MSTSANLEASVSAPNSILLIVGSDQADPPSSMNTKLVSATATCLAVGTLNEFDGETQVTIRSGHPGVLEAGWTRHTFRVDDVDGAVRVVDIEWNEVLSLSWELNSCVVVLDVDDPVEPSTIRITVTMANEA